jgi:hypothetical protein
MRPLETTKSMMARRSYTCRNVSSGIGASPSARWQTWHRRWMMRLIRLWYVIGVSMPVPDGFVARLQPKASVLTTFGSSSRLTWSSASRRYGLEMEAL